MPSSVPGNGRQQRGPVPRWCRLIVHPAQPTSAVGRRSSGWLAPPRRARGDGARCVASSSGSRWVIVKRAVSAPICSETANMSGLAEWVCGSIATRAAGSVSCHRPSGTASCHNHGHSAAVEPNTASTTSLRGWSSRRAVARVAPLRLLLGSGRWASSSGVESGASVSGGDPERRVEAYREFERGRSPGHSVLHRRTMPRASRRGWAGLQEPLHRIPTTHRLLCVGLRPLRGRCGRARHGEGRPR